MKIGIIGFGYVGSAVAASYSNDDIIINDPKFINRSVKLSEMKKKCQVIYICVPTPSDDTGKCDISILKSVIKKLKGYKGIVISKSTAPPDVYLELEKNSKLKLAHVPEFLTQSRSKYDYVNPHKIVVGCKKKIRDQVTRVIMDSMINFDHIKIEYCNIAESSFFKYMANNMLAIKVVVCNEFYDLCTKMNLNWDTITDIAKTDYRLGSTHWSVPGPDGSRGFGGACFPKDTLAFQHMAIENCIDTDILDSVIDKNKKYRK